MSPEWTLRVVTFLSRETTWGDRDSNGRGVLTASIFTVKMMAMYARRYAAPNHTFLLFGPRGTGKTTWLKQVLPDALWFDLLRTQTVLGLSRQPE